MDLIVVLLLVGTTAVVPLGLAILERRALSEKERVLLQVARRVHPIAALSLIGSFFWMPGFWAAALSLPWLLFSFLLGGIACVRLLAGGWKFPGEISYSAALAYVPIGAAWLFASRAGINPMGFGEPIVLLTGVHFHFSGFAASILAGETARHTPNYPRSARWVVLGAVSATPLIAAGFVFSWLFKAIAILYFSATLTVLAFLQVLASFEGVGLSRGLLRVSSGAVVVGMALASIYGVTEYLGWPALSIPQMARFHGMLNGLGFALCGLTGWFLRSREEIGKCIV
jgi:hypothetical protein